MHVIKKNGDTVPYDPKKVMRSMSNAGVPEAAIDDVMRELDTRIYEKMPTTKLYKLVFDLVRVKANKYAASIYSLKQAIMNLGPGGFVFEDYVARIFEILGKKVSVRQIFESMCVTHELDVVGTNFFAECKYHQ